MNAVPRAHPTAPGSPRLAADDAAAGDGVVFGATRLYLSGLCGRDVGVESLRAGSATGHGAEAPTRSPFGAAPLPARPVLLPSRLLLPAAFGEGDAETDLQRAAASHAYAHLRYSRCGRPAGSLKPIALALVSAIEDARVEALAIREYPGLRRLFLPFLRAAACQRDLSFASLVARLQCALLDDDHVDDHFWIHKGHDLFRKASDDLHDVEAFHQTGLMLANDLGQMRVRFSPQEYVVQPGYRDDNSFLWTYPQSTTPPPASMELSVAAARPPDAPRQTKPPQEPPTGPDEVAAAVLVQRYREWSHRIERYREDWCTVLDHPAEPAPGGRPQGGALARVPAAARIRAHVRNAAVHRSQRLRRQWEGEEIDLNAAIDADVARRGGEAPDPRVFLRPGRRRHRYAWLLLVDLSESTRAMVPGLHATVLDLEKQAALTLAAAVSGTGDRFALHGFCSDTRERVHYRRLVDFCGDLGEDSVGAVQAAAPRWSTRLGAALRHATGLVAAEEADRRVIIVLTDGAPSDVDVFDDRYLVEDARMAVREAARREVACRGITIDAAADGVMRTIFGHRGYRIVENPAALPVQLSHLFARLSAS